MAISTYNGIKVPGATTDTINSGTTTVGGILIDNDKYLADHVKAIEDRHLGKWSYGAETPTYSAGDAVNDMCLKSNGIVYVCSGSAWAQFCDLKGPSGDTPTMSTQTITGGTRITFTAGSSTQSIDVINGTSPTISSTAITGGNRLTIQNGSTSSYIDVMDGSDGDSCSIAVADITGGKRITVTNNGVAGTPFDIIQGSNGVTFTPSVSAAGVLSWTNDGSLTNPTSVNIKGADGASAFTSTTDSTTTPSFTVSDGASLQCTSSGLTSVTVTEPASGWTFGKYSHLYLVTSATAPTFGCPSSWFCKGDDCSDGDFSPAASTTYDLFIFRTYDTTVVSVMSRS